ncbi:hypothetical protein [Agromyces kandeliae]|uniref:Uncharacterized protein n=1 Tax=Agromyces kandeliae TaxID=2666141 RepID=A0A6L5R4R7_9MICO|nr:hypothetical protein [Agromyces kandeliae]MRX45076.1 hypothetical protein [Agromyces kandeliae]
MGFLDRLFGGSGDDRAARPAPPVPQARRLSEDELAIERYRYLLRTAPPESIEAVHAEAFAKLTPEQRQQVYRSLAEQAPAGERLVSDEPGALARAATRQELRQPGSMERAFAGAPGATGAAPGARGAAPSFGSMVGGSMLGTIAGVVIGSAIAQSFLPDPTAFDAGATDGGAEAGTDAGADAGSVDAAGGGDTGGDWGGLGDFGGGGDFGGDFGDFGF